MEGIEISVIIAVYNAEKYLRDTLDSLFKQTFKNFEIIAVNDESKDNSLKILEEYKGKFEYFTIVNQFNLGSYKTRLEGVKKAKGKYISFVDCDDIVEENFLDELYNAITKETADIAVCGFSRVDFDTKRIYSKEMCNHKIKTVDIQKNPEYLIQTNPAVWNKLFKSEIIKNLIEFENIPKILDDLTYVCLMYLKAKKITYVDKSLYNYFVHSNSIISRLSENDVEMDKKALCEVRTEYEKEKVGKNMLEMLSSIAFIHVVVSFQYRLYFQNKDDFKRIKKVTDKYMNENFPEYKTSKYLSIIFCLKNGFINFKSVIMKKIYDFKLFVLFLNVYYFLINKLKIDIKW